MLFLFATFVTIRSCRRLRMMLLGGMATILGAAPIVVEPPSGFPPITQLKRLYPSTVLEDIAGAAALVLIPDDEDYVPLAEQLAGEWRRRTGHTPLIRRASDLIDSWWEMDVSSLGTAPAVVALGHVSNNRLIARLWGEGYAAADAVFPGPGGWVVRTVHDPFATGQNVVVLGGSDGAAVAKAMPAFWAETVRGGSGELVIPEPVVKVARGERMDVYAGQAAFVSATKRISSPAEFATQLERRLQVRVSRAYDEDEAKRLTFVNLTEVLGQLAEAWFFTGDQDYHPLMQSLVEANMKLLGEIPGRTEMEAASARNMLWWDLIEELPIWSDAQRLAITNAFLADARQGHERSAAYNAVAEGYRQVVTENHGTSSAGHTFDHWRYFAKYYELPDEVYWLSIVSTTFAGQLATHQILEDASAYLVFAPQDTEQYAFKSRDMRTYKAGIARTNMEFILQCSYSNLGLSTGFGDSPSLQFPWGFITVARMGWMLQDPRVEWWWREYLPAACGIDTYDPDIPVAPRGATQVPTEWTGVSVFPLYHKLLERDERSREVQVAKREIVDRRWFNKVVLREAWSPEAQYLMLDGTGTNAEMEGEPSGPRGHTQDDINSIITYTDQNRLWLVDHSYENRSVQQHSSLLIQRDGQEGFRSHQVRLDGAVGGKHLGITQTVLTHYSGADWERTLFWRKGDWVVVSDRVIARESGHYSARGFFRGLGESKLTDGQLRLTQDGRYLQIRGDGEARQRLRHYDVPDPDSWRAHYRHAEPVVTIFEQDKSGWLDVGQTLQFGNLMMATDRERDLDESSLQWTTSSNLRVTGLSQEESYGVAALPGGWGQVGAYAIAADEVVMTGVRRLGLEGSPWLTSDVPLELCWNPDGTLRLVAHKAGTFFVLGREQSIREEAIVIDEEDVKTTFNSMLRAVHFATQEEMAQAGLDRSEKARLAAAKAGTPLAGTRLELGAVTRQVVRGDLDGDGRMEWVRTGPDGVAAYTEAGELLWSFATGAGAGALAMGDVDADGRPEIAVGTEDERVFLLGSDGKERWRFQCSPTDRSAPPVPDDIRIVDLDNDGPAEVIIAANMVHCLEADGSLRWEDYWLYQRGRKIGDVQSMDVSDYNRDGYPEVVVAILRNYSIAVGYDRRGERIYPIAKNLDGHRPLRIDAPNGIMLMDLFEDGGNELIVAAGESAINLRWAGGERDTMKAEDLSGGANLLAQVTVAGERPVLVAAKKLGTLVAYQAQSHRDDVEYTAESNGRADIMKLKLGVKWRRIGDAEITAISAGRGANGSWIFLGEENGTFRLIDAVTGDELGATFQENDPVIGFVGGPGEVTIVRSSGLLERVRPPSL